LWEAFLKKGHRLTTTITLSTLTDPLMKTKSEVIVSVSLVGVVLLIMRIGSRPKNKFLTF
jgi:hypothetical protein